MKTAIPIIVAGLLLMLLGVGQQTLWAPDETVTASVREDPAAAPVTVVDPRVVGDSSEFLELTVEADGPFVLAAGRSADVAAWVGDAARVSVTGRSEDVLTVERTDGEDAVPDPRGSDLWVVEEPGDGTLTYRWNAPAEGEWSILLAADGTDPAPVQLSVVVPADSSTPFALPLIIGGALVVVLGIVMLLLPPRGRGGRRAGAGTRAHARQRPGARTRRGRRARPRPARW
ncbi:hypothetical protein AC792_09865 [Arthrobacter sp. RIT-PI-e]|uniref:hypothetical protein n=1 Tax=Arthrobacter sp. RIT-PI-e TaxID=1681197 RepID=UPI0006A17D30|nr:hypothetical protein [Arthrobacter sp. RIT-PI-e]KNC18810.1 hypothetical protein AC792_09865 [Arthrobacter sp. RIT-PI-e]